jgi:hypothetical protein
MGGATPGDRREHIVNPIVPPTRSRTADFSSPPCDVSTHLMSLLGVNDELQPNQYTLLRGVFTVDQAEESMRRQGEAANTVPDYYSRPHDMMFGPAPVMAFQRQAHGISGASVPLSGSEMPFMLAKPHTAHPAHRMQEAAEWASSCRIPGGTHAAPRLEHDVPPRPSPSLSLSTSAVPTCMDSIPSAGYNPVRGMSYPWLQVVGFMVCRAYHMSYATTFDFL